MVSFYVASSFLAYLASIIISLKYFFYPFRVEITSADSHNEILATLPIWAILTAYFQKPFVHEFIAPFIPSPYARPSSKFFDSLFFQNVSDSTLIGFIFSSKPHNRKPIPIVFKNFIILSPCTRSPHTNTLFICKFRSSTNVSKKQGREQVR